jgi:hypothetical protein
MGLYSLVGIIAMMLAAIVVTQDPEGSSEFTEATRKRRVSSVSRGPAESFSATAGSSQK